MKIKFAFLLILFCSLVFAEPSYIVSGSSMKPVLVHGQKVKVEFGSVSRGDIIFFSIFSKRTFTKTVFALYGDLVEIRGNVLFVNGKEAKGRTLQKIDVNDVEFKRISRAILNGQVKEGYYLVVSENPDNRYDSRAYGPISISQIKGKIQNSDL